MTYLYVVVLAGLVGAYLGIKITLWLINEGIAYNIGRGLNW
jgi:hypothetical protein